MNTPAPTAISASRSYVADGRPVQPVASRARARGLPLGVLLLGIVVGQAIVIWLGYAALRAF